MDIGKQHTMCLLLCCLVFNICECGFQRSKVVLVLVNDLQNHITLRIIGHFAKSGNCPRLYNATLTGRTYTPSAV